MTKINFGGIEEEVVTRDEFPLEKAREVLKDEVVAELGYGVQGPAQALNMRDNGIKVIVGQREGTKIGIKPGGWLGSRRDVVLCLRSRERGTVVQYCFQMQVSVRNGRSRGMSERGLCFISHRILGHFQGDTGVIRLRTWMWLSSREGRDVVCDSILDGSESTQVCNSPDATAALRTYNCPGNCHWRRLSFSTTFKNEVHSDLNGERGV